MSSPSSSSASGYSSPSPQQQPLAKPNTMPAPSTVSNFPAPSSTSTIPTSTMTTGSPIFVVSRSWLSSILPAMVYLVFIFFITNSTGSFSLLTIIIIVVFVLVAILPILLTPRRYEFYDSSLKIHKIIGGDTELPYSDITLYDAPMGRRPQIVLSVAGQRRPIVIPGNPTNKESGQNLNQFLNQKLKKYNPQSTNQQEQSSTSSDMDTMTTDDDVDTTSDQSTNP